MEARRRFVTLHSNARPLRSVAALEAGSAHGVIALTFTLAGFGIAQAVIPSADGTLALCYVTKNGKARVVDAASACKAGKESKLTWNGNGSRAYALENGVGVVTNGSTQTVASVSVPAGKYAVTLSATALDIQSLFPAGGSCYLQGTTSGGSRAVDFYSPDITENLATNAVVTRTTNGAIEAVCNAVGSHVSYQSINLTAVRVA
jgi:hypothetical protein